MRHSILVGAIAVAMGALVAQPAAADKVSDLYSGKTVTILFGYGTGGTYGKTSLVLSHHLGKHIPGNPTIITQSMPGAGGMKAANYAYNAMPKNGLYLLMPPDMSMVSQVLRPKKVKYDARNFTYLGRVFGSNNLIAVRRDSGVTTLEQAKTKQVIMGSTGKGSPTFIVTSLANGLVGTKFKIVQGYKGSARTKLAMEQGEVFGISLAWASWKNDKLAWFTGPNSFAVGLLQSGYKRDKDWPNIPLISEMVTDADAKAAADLIATSTLIGRSLALPPGAPGFLTEPLRKAFWETVNSKAFMDDATRTKLPLLQKKGAEIQATVDQILNMSPVAVAKARSAIFGK
jgi:hypothetical protein